MKDSNDAFRRDAPLNAAVSAYSEAWADGNRLDPDQFCREHAECGPELRRWIDQFLFVAEGLRSDSPAIPADRPAEGQEHGLGIGKRLGDFELIREVGRGGMGVVFEADQISLDRRVALKVLPSHLTLRPESVERFKREASTASRLKHPAIVEIYSVGEDEGTHFFAMELVDGTPLNRIIDQLRAEDSFPATGEKLVQALGKNTYIEAVCSLVSQVADALDHAHNAAVIHRDVKPSNILLRCDGSAVLTDFGLAREERLPSLTVTGELAGTPHYVSPEQACPQRKKIDLRTDIYSLGVTLYELLTLTRPFDGKTAQEILGKIINEEPLQPRTSNPLIPRDLETICLAAMEKSPDRRYQTARDLADDIARFLKFEPVRARPIGILTRSLRVLRRNPTSFALVGLICLVVVGGPLVFGIQQHVAKNRLGEALLLAEEEAERARLEAETARQACDYVIDLFKMSSPDKARGKTISAFEIIRQGEANLKTYFSNKPKIRARFNEVIGLIYTALGLYTLAEPLLEEAMVHHHREKDESNILSIRSEYNLGHLYVLKGRPEKGERILDPALAASRKVLGEEHPLTLEIMNDRAEIYIRKGQLEIAEQLLVRIHDTQRRLLSPEHPDTLETVSNLAHFYRSNGDSERSEALALEVYEGRRRVLGVDHPDTLASMRDMTVFYAFHDRYEEIEPLYHESFETHCRVFGADHPNTLSSQMHLAYSLAYRGRFEDADLHYRQALDGRRRRLGAEHPETLLSLTMLASFLHDRGQDEEADRLFHEALNTGVRILGFDYNQMWIIVRRVTRFYIDLGRFDEAKVLLRAVLEHIPSETRQYDEFKALLEQI